VINHLYDEERAECAGLAPGAALSAQATCSRPGSAHDLLHLRQLIELHWAYTQRATQPYQTRYAGDW
jgi:hypothetical protein